MSKPVTTAAKPIAPWVGGKRALAKRICAIIDADDHATYAEPFTGMGGIFLRRASLPKAEYINDASRDVYNLFRILQEHYIAFLDLMRFQVTTQANFERLVTVDPDTLTDLQRAARFLFLQRTSFGGKVAGRHFGISADRPARFNITTLEPDLEALHSRLAGVTITCLDYAAFITRIDREGTFFYLDPPYWGCEDYYGKELFTRADFERLAEVLGQIKGRFLLSLNDVPEVRKTFADFRIAPVSVKYTINKAAGGGSRPDRAELLISNFEWEGS